MNTLSKIFNSASAKSTTKNESLRRYMLGVYNYMSLGLFITAFISFFVAKTSLIYYVTGTPLAIIFAFLPLGISLYLQFRIQSMSIQAAKMTFFLYAASMGLSLSYIFIAYNPIIIAQSFFITTSMFAFMSIYGYTTKKDLSSYGSMFMMLMWGLIISSIVNLFTKSSAFSFLISVGTVVVFTGLIAYDTKMIKQFHAQAYSDNSGIAKDSVVKFAILAALMLYINFVGIFVNLLRILSRRNDR